MRRRGSAAVLAVAAIWSQATSKPGAPNGSLEGDSVREDVGAEREREAHSGNARPASSEGERSEEERHHPDVVVSATGKVDREERIPADERHHPAWAFQSRRCSTA